MYSGIYTIVSVKHKMKQFTILTLFTLTISLSAFGQLRISGDNRFVIDSSRYNGQTATDTLYYVDKKIQAIGQVALEKDLKKSDYKVGLWIEFYPNGKVKSQGNYQIDSYIQCCYAGYCRQFINYKTGKWTYYYDNGQIKATGSYTVKKEKIKTSCKGGDKVMTSRIDNFWTFYNETGDKVNLTDDLKKEFENARR
jgi:antitoxin component YwqK of YwqJK toxin-antitoxin module